MSGFDGERLTLALDGFEGPLDLLLDLARAQKVDLARISILALVEQYLAVVEGARRIKLELAADWLVMAAWLAWLKSRLLLPAASEGAAEAGDAADALAERLRELERMRAAALWLGARPQLGQDVFARGAAETLVETDSSGLKADMPELLRGYLDAIRRVAAKRVYVPKKLTLNFWTVQDALSRLSAVLGRLPPWSTLEAYLPEGLSGEEHRAAIASTLVASLELARGGGVKLRQEEAFGPILLAPGAANEA
ncbi:MAG TPA: ScpA family protein [Acetobacteraceae bacterium]|nr:ScpA family protein [Acetobacteraceae bacterium]